MRLITAGAAGAGAPVLGGVFKAESVAPTSASSSAARLPGEGQCNLLTPCRPKDRVISSFPRKAFGFRDGDDEPNTSVICGEGGPGFFPRLLTGPQWTSELYALDL